MPSINDIRSNFLNYFVKNGHEIVAASPLVPRNDPTLMFVNSGMVQFKNLFTGVEVRDYKRVTTSQKCVRAGGKHNDLDNVGYTARHHTFFEMLGNFSFGDYFKNEAINYAWELLTKEFGLKKDRLLVTVYKTDDEAAEIWKKVTGFGDDKIIRIDTSDNFWAMGPTGPCGPCTEIFYDHGDHIRGGPPGSPEEDGDRFIEIWNLVFMQNEKFEDGSIVTLDNQSIDTGMGLERIGALLQGKYDNYDTDLMRALIESSADLSDGAPDGPGKIHHRVIADHIRSSSFLIADGVMPANDGRGYVLRRIMRRAMRHAHLLGAKDPIMHRLVSVLVSNMGVAYSELQQAESLIGETLLNEETRFKETLDRGLKLLDEELANIDASDDLPGETAFKLYDTYGFPLDLTQDALREKGRSVDVNGFDAAMNEQKAKARASWSGTGETADAAIWFDISDKHGASEFLGYDTEIAEGQCLTLVKEGAEIQESSAGEVVQIVVNQTPFYAESGGQIGDSGHVQGHGFFAEITDTKKVAGVFIHFAKIIEGALKPGNSVLLTVDVQRRRNIQANHSATHLLHEALRRALGNHVAQKGSLNSDDRLRFDFSHAKALNAEELRTVEREVNAYIRQNTVVETRIMTPDNARKLGAQALFGEKYGDEVRVVSMGHLESSGKGNSGNVYSLELCGGIHVRQTGDIGILIVIGDSASSAGVRRIEALTGDAAYTHLSSQSALLASAAAELKVRSVDVPERIKSLLTERKSLSNEVVQLRRELAMAGGASLRGVSSVRLIADINFVAQVLDGVSGKDLPALIDEYKSKIGSCAVLLLAEVDGKVAVCAGVSDDLTKKISAVDLVQAAVPVLGGKGGGGRPDMARGGGNDISQANAAFKAAETVLEGVQ